MLKHVRDVAYRLELPPNFVIHPIFHVSVLKKRVGMPKLIATNLPTFNDEGLMILKPKEVLQYRSGTKG